MNTPASLKRLLRNRLERGADTVEFVIVLIVVVVIGAGLLALSGTMGDQVTKTGQTIDSWFSKAGVQNKPSNATNSGTNNSISEELLNKDPKDWTLDDQKRVAEDISAKGNSSKLYTKAKSAMAAGTTWSVTLTNGKEMKYRIIGIAHDDLADGSGRAGLTFRAENYAVGRYCMNAIEINAGGWEASELRQEMNSGEIWNLMPTELQGKVETVIKLTNNLSGKSKNAVPTATSDRLFILSYAELDPTSSDATDYPWILQEGSQYEAFQDEIEDLSTLRWWMRSCIPATEGWFYFSSKDNRPNGQAVPFAQLDILPAWCF